MSLRVVDNQMMLQRPPELTTDRVRDIQRTGLNVNMAFETALDAQKELTTVQHSTETDKMQADKDGHNSQQTQEEEEKKKEEEKKQAGLKQYANHRLLDLPVTNRKFAMPEKHNLDIEV